MQFAHESSNATRALRHRCSPIGRGIAAGAFLGALAAPASAQLDISAAAHASTLGWGLEGDILLTPHIGARAMYNEYTYSLSKTSSGNTYDGTLSYENFPLVLDYYLSAKGLFHLTGGIVLNQNKVAATALLPWSYNGVTFTSADLTAPPVLSVTWPSVGWYAGFGWGTPVRTGSHFGFVADIGVMGGVPTVQIVATCASSSITCNNATPTLQASLQQAADSIQNDLKTYASYYPVISIGVNYKF